MNDLLHGIRSGDRRSLARAITLAESTRHEDRAAAAVLLDELAPRTGGAIRLGISGTPGVGKSSFIETLGAHLVDAGLRVAVLAVDPSSSRGRGAILGDKTRMQTLTRHPNAFIRPSPAGHSLGGVTAVTSDAVQFADAFGFDVILIETVGVGQSEVAVTSMTDLFLLLVAPGGGDDLQGIKRGVLEVADFIVVNKTDGDFRDQAFVTAADYRAALSMVRPRTGWPMAEVLNCSSFDVDSIVAVWEAVSERWTQLRGNGKLESARAIKRRELLAARVRHLLVELATERTEASAAAERAVVLGQRSIAGAATEILEDILACHTPDSRST